MRTRDAIASVNALSQRGVRFLHLPYTYDQVARERCSEFDLPWRQLEELGIEVDKDSGGYLLQIFSEMITDRPTLFMEVIQREGATGFGEGNFKALFEAIERDPKLAEATSEVHPVKQRAAVEALPSYRPGRSAQQAMDDHGLASVVIAGIERTALGPCLDYLRQLIPSMVPCAWELLDGLHD